MKKRLTAVNIFIVVFTMLIVTSPIFSQPVTIKDASHLELELKKLNVLGSVLYVAAHPDDENNALLSYLASGKMVRTGYLSMTRGDGGQNLIGEEQGANLGVLRTQELLAARRIDGAEQFFTRAIDFGYSKSGEETMKIWNKQKILSDVVWVVRKFRPDVIITRFPGTGEGGHGNHTASQILAKEAFEIAGDSTAFPEQLKYVNPWKPKRIYWNAWLSIIEKRNEDVSKLLTVDLGKFNPLLGKTYNEVAAISRSMHKSQGFGSSPHRGENINYFEYTEGAKAHNTLFDGIDLSWNRIKNSTKVSEYISKAINQFDPENPAKIIPVLLDALKEMNKLHEDYWVPLKKKQLEDVIRNCAGMWIESIAEDYSVVPGHSLDITSSILNRSNFPFKLKSVQITYQKGSSIINKVLSDETPSDVKTKIIIPSSVEYTQPYWLKDKPNKGNYVVDNQRLIGKAENDPPLTADFILEAEGVELHYNIPVLYRWNDLVEGEKYRPIDIVPDIAVNIENKVYVFPNNDSKDVNITLRSNEDNAEGTLKLNLPESWESTPEKIDFNLNKKNDEKTFTFSVKPPEKYTESKLSADVLINNRKIDRGMITINYSHIPIQTLFPIAEAKIIRLNTKKVINNIGYIMGTGDYIPSDLKQLGYNVSLLSDKDLENDSLNQFDAIIIGIRAYNTREKLPYYHQKLMNYVKNGGTLVAQYNVTRGLYSDNIGPYPFEISHDRVTVEEAPVTFVDSTNQLLNYPNKITHKDFDNWVQERGLYFPNKWDSHYQTVIECNDPGEHSLSGGLLFTKYGKGDFIYTGYSFFRQLPAGNPGAFRLFVNLISAGNYAKQEHHTNQK